MVLIVGTPSVAPGEAPWIEAATTPIFVLPNDPTFTP